MGAARASDTTEQSGGIAALEHLTGRCRGTVSWLGGSALDVSLSPRGDIQITTSHAERDTDRLIARLRRTDDGYDLEASAGSAVWINGRRADAQRLRDRDMVEFGEAGPLSRFHVYRDSRPVRKTFGEIVSDSIAYLRVSRQPGARRLLRAATGFIRRLARETTVLFRISVVVALCILAVFAYQQNRINTLLEHRIESGAAELRSFANALARARDEALTPGDLEALRQELATRLLTNAERLTALEKRSRASAEVIARSAAAVAFLQGAYGFREQATGRMLRHAVDEKGHPIIMPGGQPFLTLEGDGPVAERQFTGTAFALDDGSVLVTNRHLALPWEHDAGVETLSAQGLEPMMIKLLAYLPGRRSASPVELLRASDTVDMAILRFTGAEAPLPSLALSDAVPSPGEEVIVMGYPTGLRALLFQAGDAFIKRLQESGNTDFWAVAAHLAEAGLIAPLASRGIVAHAAPAAIIYDAETTHGGSGGPVLAIDGTVVAVNTAILPEYGGSNLGVPAGHIKSLLSRALEPKEQRH